MVSEIDILCVSTANDWKYSVEDIVVSAWIICCILDSLAFCLMRRNDITAWDYSGFGIDHLRHLQELILNFPSRSFWI